ncbi:putative HC-toxin efflux carrier [Dichotomopilus funicola]|uniref:HC-toxin efflux carrier n=1 Tax=Dichotomopilus funicola TaxID=1934379 RepID=A0AAN6V6Q0_9PEZI|nr:putative HC-toxin efflux carrier [Dichotomopilus funicola]
MAMPRSIQSEGGEHFQPKSLRFWLTLFCNFLALFLVAIDRTIIATAVPRISDEFQALGDIGWYGSSYMLTTACAQLLFGRIYKFYDMKWTFLLSIVVFEIGSVICGAAPNSNTFIAGRAVAGLGSAGIFSGCLLIMIPLVPLNHRPLFQGIFGGVFGLASVMGPLVGGGFTGQVTWRWCFYINLPIGGVVLILMYLCWNSPKKHHDLVNPADHINRLNPLGMIFLLPGIVCLFLAFQWGGSTYQWNEWRIVLLLVLFGLCTTAFIAVQILRPENATVPPKVITQRSVACATSFTFFLAGSMLMLVYYMPIWFQTVKAVDPMRSGINTLPLVLSLVISSIISGVVTHRIGYYVPSMYVGPALMSIGEGLLSTLDRSSPTSHWVSYQFISGFGLGCGMQTGSLAVQKVLPPDDVSTGVAIINFAQQLGGAVFTSVGQTILTNILVSELSHLPGFDPKLLVSEGATQIVQRVGPENADLVINAYNTAIRHTFQTSMGLAFASFLCAFGMEWKTVKKGKKEPGPPENPPPVVAEANTIRRAAAHHGHTEGSSISRNPSPPT